MGFLNENLLKQFSSGSGVVKSLASPAVAGTGIAGVTALGIYQLLKERKKEQSSNAYGPTSPMLPGNNRFEQISETSKIYGISRPASSLYQQGYLRSAMMGAKTPAEANIRIQTSQFKASIEMLKELSTIRKAFGMDFTLDYSEKIQKDASWLEKVAKGSGVVHKGIQNIPGVKPLENLTKTVLKIGKMPYDIAKTSANFLDTFTTKVKGFLSGGLLYAQSDEGLAKKSGRVLKDFVKDGGLAEGISGTIHELQKANLFHSKILGVLEKTSGFTANREDIEQLISQGQQVYNPYTGEFVSRKQYTATRESAIRDAFMSSFRGILGDIVTWKKDSSESALQKDTRRAKKAYLSFTDLNEEVGNYFGKVSQGQTGYSEYIGRLHNYLNISEDKKISEGTLFNQAKSKYGQEERIEKPEPPIAGVNNSRQVIAGRERLGLRQTSRPERKFIAMGTAGVGGLALGGLAAGGLVGGATGAALGPIGMLAGLGLGVYSAYKGRQKGKESIIERREAETGIEFVNVLTDLKDTLITGNITSGKNIPGSPSPGKPFIPKLIKSDDYGTATPILQGLSSVETQTAGTYSGISKIVKLLEDNSQNIWEHDNWMNIGKIVKYVKNLVKPQSVVKKPSDDLPSGDKFSNVVPIFRKTQAQSQELGGYVHGTPGEEVPVRAHAGELILPADLSKHFTTFFKDRVFGLNKKTQSFELGGMVSSDIKSQISDSKMDKKEKVRKELAENLAEATGEAGSNIPAIRKPSIYAYLREMWEVTTGKKKRKDGEDGGFFSGLMKGGGLLPALFGGATIGGFLKNMLFGKKDSKGKRKGFFKRLMLGKKGKKGFLKLLAKGSLKVLGVLGAGYFFLKGITSDASTITEDKDPGTFQRLGAGAASVMSSLLFGLVEPKTIYGVGKNLIEKFKTGLSNIWPKMKDWGTTASKKMLDGINFVSNWKNAATVVGKEDPNTLQKLGAVGANVASSLLLGQVEPETIYDATGAILTGIGQDIVNMLPSTSDAKLVLKQIWTDHSTDVNTRITKLTGSGTPGIFQSMGATAAMILHDVTFGLFDEERVYKETGIFLNAIGDDITSPFKNAYSGISELTKLIRDLTVDDFLRGIFGNTLFNAYTDAKNWVKDRLKAPSTSTVDAGGVDPSSPEGKKWAKAETERVKSLTPKQRQKENLEKERKELIEKSKLSTSKSSVTSSVTSTESSEEMRKRVWEEEKAKKAKRANEPTLFKFLTQEFFNPWSKTWNPDKEKDKKVKIGKYTTTQNVLDSIQKASKEFGIPYPYMLAMAGQESSLDPNAKSSKSTATGLYQFIDSTWAEQMPKYKPEDRFDPYLSAQAAAKYLKGNIPGLPQDYKKSYPAWYMTHLLGLGGTRRFLNNMKENPNTPVESGVDQDSIDGNKALLDVDNLSIAYKKISDKITRQFKQINMLDSMRFKKGGTVPGYVDGDIVNEEDPVKSEGLGKIPQLTKADPEKDSVMVAAQPGELIIPKGLSGRLLSFFKRVIKDEMFSGNVRSQFAKDGTIAGFAKPATQIREEWEAKQTSPKTIGTKESHAKLLAKLDELYKQRDEEIRTKAKSDEDESNIIKNYDIKAQKMEKGYESSKPIISESLGEQLAKAQKEIPSAASKAFKGLEKMDVISKVKDSFKFEKPLKGLAEKISGMINSVRDSDISKEASKSANSLLGNIRDTISPEAEDLNKKISAARKRADNNVTKKREQNKIKAPGDGLGKALTNERKKKKMEEKNSRQEGFTRARKQADDQKAAKPKPSPGIVMQTPSEQGSNPIKSKYELPLDPIMIGIMGNFLTGTLNYFDRAIHDAFVFGGDGLSTHGQLT
jgi:hypothetical protein